MAKGVDLQTAISQKTAVYIGVGKEGLAPTAAPHVMGVEANVLAEKLRSSPNKFLTTYFDYLPQEDHAAITHQAVFNAFRLLYPVPDKKQCTSGSFQNGARVVSVRRLPGDYIRPAHPRRDVGGRRAAPGVVPVDVVRYFSGEA